MADCSFRRRRYYGQVFSGRWTVAFLKDGLAPFYCQTLIHNWFIVKIPEVTGAMPMHRTGAHFWSIAVEEQFYLIALLLLLVLIPLRHSIPAWSLLTAAAGGFLFALAFASAAYLVINQRVLRRRGAFYTPALGRAAMVSACSMMALGILLDTVVIGPLDGGPTP